MPCIALVTVGEDTAKLIFSKGKRSRPIVDIAKDLTNIENEGHRAVNLDDARKLELIGLEILRHARDTVDCCH